MFIIPGQTSFGNFILQLLYMKNNTLALTSMILVIDDDIAVRTSLQLLLKSEGV
jgi:hypothetical protein